MAITLNRRQFLKLSSAAAASLTANLTGFSRWSVEKRRGAAWHKAAFVLLDVPSAKAQSCLTLVQSPWLGMVALGDNTMPDPNKGNHLRWGFESALGFPDHGFDLYRRPHFEGQPACITLQGYSGDQNLGKYVTLGELLLESPADIRTVELVAENGVPEIDLRGKPPLSIWPRENCHRIRISVVDFAPSGGTIRATAYDGDRQVAAATTAAVSGVQILDLAADRIQRIVVHAAGSAMDGVLTQVCHVTIAADVCSGQFPWTPLNQEAICLPLSDASYPCPTQPPTPGEEWPAAQRRIPPETWGQYEPPEFTGLRDTLAAIYHPDAVVPLTAEETEACPPPVDEETTPDFSQDALGLVLLASLDPHIARMLGLYWIDGKFYTGQGLQVAEPALVGTAYDYLLVAHYPDAADLANACDGWDGDAAGTTLSDTIHHGPFTYDTPLALPVVDRDIVAFGTHRALSIADNRGNPLRITLLEPVEAVELYVDIPEAGTRALVRAYSHGVEVDTATRAASLSGPTKLLLLAESIDAVELEGNNLYLAQTCCYTAYTPGGDMGFVAYNVVLGDPPDLMPPEDLTGDALAVLTRRDPNCDPVTSQMAAGLHWGAALAGAIVADGVVMYDLERQGLGNGGSPRTVDPGAWGTVKTNMLVVPDPPDAACEPYEALPAWPTTRPNHIDAPPDDPQQRWYAYRVRGIDIFGRRSAYRESTPIDLADTVPPPPPLDVQAKYLDPADPYLTGDEYTWTHPASGPRHGLRISWLWTDNLQEQAPDVAQFRVYFKSGRLNTVLGMIEAVEPSEAGDIVHLTTDVAVESLPAGETPDAFQGEFLAQGVYLYQVTASGASAGRLTLTIRRDSWAPPVDGIEAPELQPIPDRDAFSLSVRPAKLLAGKQTSVSVAEFSEDVWAETDVRYPGASDELAGKMLRQGGRLWEILGNTTGWNFAIHTRRRVCEPHAPAQGETFLVVEADGVTPYLLDPGNPHGRDYRNPLNWEKRILVEPHSGPGVKEFFLSIGPLAIAPGQPAAFAAVAVSAADDKPYVPDAWSGALGGQHGNESALSPPAIVVRVDRSTSPAPAPNLDVLMATPADFYSRSFFTVRWAKRPEPGLRYRVYRALEDVRDTEDPPGSGQHPPPLARYHLITPEPIRPENHPDFSEPGHAAVDPSLIAYRDTLDGKSSSRYYYRVRAVSAAGVAGDWSDSVGPVACPDVVPPRTPVITKVLGGDRQITLIWASNREPDLAMYRVYRADSKENAADLRLMTLVHTEEVAAGDPAARPAEVQYVDSAVTVYQETFYRVEAVDRAGNRSVPSPARSGKAYDYGPPSEPVWERSEWVKLDEAGVEHPWSDTAPGLLPAVALSFTVAQGEHVAGLAQRKEKDSWRSITAWVRTPTYAASTGAWRFTLHDRSARPNASHRYRARLINRAGRVLESTAERVVPAP